MNVATVAAVRKFSRREVDLAARAVEVFRRPEGGRYVTVTRVDAAAELASLAFPDVTFPVKDILPTP